MCCAFLLAFGIGPRIALIFVWIFGDRVDAAFSSWVWPLLGLLFLPWTTLMYILAWGPVYGVSGWGWVLVGDRRLPRPRHLLGPLRQGPLPARDLTG